MCLGIIHVKMHLNEELVWVTEHTDINSFGQLDTLCLMVIIFRHRVRKHSILCNNSVVELDP